MSRIVNLLLVCLMVLAAAAVYDMKYEAEAAAERVSALERDVAAEQERISLLKATWAALTRPERLQELVTRHQDTLHLQPMDPSQLATIADIPDASIIAGAGAEASQKDDEIVTGSVRRAPEPPEPEVED
ncbi:putative secreted (periplasmic) protein [Hartmannibacter diazotrophicus]|uniref:Putative secreted (Periplasmic) protein n=2 Tax=Hartmannibacter diazotrophicus TaxID=1482074 RepID=A0A2C9D870_9HYPH|nr:putative secreted (periplasmic) protein [Hartmannibacter diazotrophicus]